MPRPFTVLPRLALVRRRPRLPAGLLRRRLQHRGCARILDVPQAELERIDPQRMGDFVHERLAGEVDLRADRIAQVRACATARRARGSGGIVSQAVRLLANP